MTFLVPVGEVRQKDTPPAEGASAGGTAHTGTRVKLLGPGASAEPCALWVFRLGSHQVLTVKSRRNPRVPGSGGE